MPQQPSLQPPEQPLSSTDPAALPFIAWFLATRLDPAWSENCIAMAHRRGGPELAGEVQGILRMAREWK